MLGIVCMQKFGRRVKRLVLVGAQVKLSGNRFAVICVLEGCTYKGFPTCACSLAVLRLQPSQNVFRWSQEALGSGLAFQLGFCSRSEHIKIHVYSFHSSVTCNAPSSLGHTHNYRLVMS